MRRVLPRLKIFCAILVVSLFAGWAHAAVLRVCEGDGCDYPVSAASVNAAIKAANCGDVIRIQAGAVIPIPTEFDVIKINKKCPQGQELVITTTQDGSWLPGAHERITPGYLAHMPLFDVTGGTGSQPIFQLDQPGNSGVVLRHLAIRMHVDPASAPYSVVKVGPPIPTSLESLGTNVTLDGVYITGDFVAKNRVNNPVQVNGNAAVINSFFDDIHKGPFEEGYHIYISNDSVGPFWFENNYFGGGVSIGSLTGGGSGPYFTAGQPHPQGYVVQHNYFYNSPRFYAGSAGYVGDANRPCIKNFFELKTGDNALIRWNGGENSFNGCGSQWSGFVVTVRNVGAKQGGQASLTPDRGTIKITNYASGSAVLPPQPGYLIGIAKLPPPISTTPAPGQFEWRTITGVVAPFTYTVDQPFPGDLPNTTNAEWALLTMPWGRINSVNISGNFLKNTANPLLTLGKDDFQQGGTLQRLTFKNNLTVNDSPLMVITDQQFFQHVMAKMVNGGDNITIENNSFVVKDPIVPVTNFFQLEPSDPALHNIVNGLRLRNNVAPWGLYGISSSGVDPNTAWNTRTDSQLDFRNNVLLGMSPSVAWRPFLEGCTAPRICQDNYFVTGDPKVDFTKVVNNLSQNDYSLGTSPTGAYIGSDGAAAGVDVEQVPIIRGLSVVPGATQLQFQWGVSQVLRYTVCSLEVSADRGLIDDSGTFTAVNALRPDYFKRANYDLYNSRSAILNGGLNRMFQVGENVQVMDDLGVRRDLSLAPNTVYNYRVMCGGTTERGSIRTLAN